ncbi:type IV pilus modification PilV family protein [Tumebacillus flagellatus]|uniref:Prepilin-type N-terminal cleavage/methylation domain-containing protein n=1 Tax=Tumebacillus flagellatus TaxID=1157490 RepID=A0A074LQD6_9BACL|nr:prepilin-type N-terminal cleavage/methylation domain-containing protein [Tumebacillus flagellatus]KEO82695.1 hypothetical protein EL26_14105 [Tumebacillus flagellatus]
MLKNEQGLTLLELLIAVVVLTIVALPLTSIGTTVYRWYKEDQLKNQAVLLAEQTVQEQKAVLEVNGFTYPDDPHVVTLDPNVDGLQATVTLQRHDFGTPDVPVTHALVDVTVEIKGPDLEQAGGARKALTTLATTVRQKAAGVTP